MTVQTGTSTLAAQFRARVGDPAVGLLFEDQSWTWGRCMEEAAVRAELLLESRRPGPFHVGYLSENTPDLTFWLAAGSFAGATMVGINSTRRGAELARDVRHTDCQLLVVDQEFLGLVRDLDTGLDADRVLVVGSEAYLGLLGEHAGAPVPSVDVRPDDVAFLVFTSGTTAAPKAVICTQERVGRSGRNVSAMAGLTAADTWYQSMPMFHGNALFAGWAPTVFTGATLALRRRFSASAFFDDVRRFGATHCNYVGKPLSYVLATPESPLDREHPLRIALGNEAGPRDIRRFAERFGVRVMDSYGSTENAATATPHPDQPAGSLGRPSPGVTVRDPETAEPCPPAEFDENHKLLNAGECIGEIVNLSPGTVFQGYYKNPDADRSRMRNGWYWSGDLGYLDRDGWLYFAGRDRDWLRVDGENFAAAPIEDIVLRHPAVALASVYAVPDPQVGDQVMVTVQVSDPEHFDAADFDRFLAEQPDMGTKWLPTFVRATTAIPLSGVGKIVKPHLQAERWRSADPTYWRRTRQGPLVRITPEVLGELEALFGG